LRVPDKKNSPGPRYAALIQLLRTAEALWNTSREFFARWDLSPSQFNVLNILREFPDGLSQTEISRELITHRSNVTGLIDRLEARGLVARRAVAADRRAYRVAVTAKGHALLSEILPIYYRAAEAAWSGLSESRASQIVTDLARITDNAAEIVARQQKETR
jgi:DNA-binding MarR family transcriptional regulator